MKKSQHRNLKLRLTRPPIPGECRWCKLPINDPKTGARLTRKTWHTECVGIYESQAHPQTLRQHILARDKGICAHCGVDAEAQYRKACRESVARHGFIMAAIPNWQADHIVPLAAGGSFEHSNVQTLCVGCHHIKLKDDLKLIREFRKGGGNPLTPLPPH